MPPVPLRENSRAQQRADPISSIINYGSGFSSQSSPKHFQQCTELSTLRNRSLGPLTVTVLAVALTRGRAATDRSAVEATAPFLSRGRSARPPAPDTGELKGAAASRPD
jgi:hypothetical protein